MDFLKDLQFLKELNAYHTREYWAAIIVLDFETEMPIERIEAKVISGSMTLANSSPTRRTGSLQLVFDPDFIQIKNPTNLIQINKKISLSIGLTNPFPENGYGEVLWFPQGIFFITQASAAIAVQSSTISVNLIDKMGMLNGVCGGVLPANTSFHDRIIIDKDGNTTTEFPIISQIIRELVHHFGGEHYSKIFVSDVPDVGRRVVKYTGETPIRFSIDGGSYIISETNDPTFPRPFYQGDTIGYMETPLTYPGELIMNAGATVTQVLDEIVAALGNFEYFYDIEGNFIFRQIQNYNKTGNTPFIAGVVPTTGVTFDDALSEQLVHNMYLAIFNDDQYINHFADTSMIASINQTPQYSQIKNDFVAWGSRSDGDSEIMVRYHLAIDEQPREAPDSLCWVSIAEVKDAVAENILRYALTSETLAANEVWGETVAPDLRDVGDDHLTLSYNWREELYRRALMAWGTSARGSYYDEELMAEWRLLYDPTNKNFRKNWEDHFGVGGAAPQWEGYTPDILIAPERVRYWLDLIDTATEIGQYSVNRIGRRTIVSNNSKINEVLSSEINDIVFVENTGDNDEMEEKARYYISIGQDYCFVTPEHLLYFDFVNSFGTCFEDARQMLYEGLFYNTTISVQALPAFYLDVNKIINLTYPTLGVAGNYIINSISWSLGYNSMMNISAHEAITII